MFSLHQTGSVTLRTVTAVDATFLRTVYASTRAEELAPLGWNEAQKGQFLEMQFRAQDVYYHTQFAGACFQIIECLGKPIGRLYTEERADEIRVIDIALLPEHRRKGIGSSLMRAILAEAAKAGKRVCIHVERFNPALQWYERLGFRTIADQGVYLLMEWLPGKDAAGVKPPAAAVV